MRRRRIPSDHPIFRYLVPSPLTNVTYSLSISFRPSVTNCILNIYSPRYRNRSSPPHPTLNHSSLPYLGSFTICTPIIIYLKYSAPYFTLNLTFPSPYASPPSLHPTPPPPPHSFTKREFSLTGLGTDGTKLISVSHLPGFIGNAKKVGQDE